MLELLLVRIQIDIGYLSVVLHNIKRWQFEAQPEKSNAAKKSMKLMISAKTTDLRQTASTCDGLVYIPDFRSQSQRG